MGEAEEVTSGGRGLLSVDDKLGEIADMASANRKLLSDTLDEIAGMSHGANGRRLLSTLWSQITSAQGEDVLARQQKLGVSPDDETDHAARRNLLSTELESIASTSAEANRQLLAAEELPDELAGKRELLSRTLMGIDEAATEAKRQLDEATMEDTMSGGHPEHRVLTTGLIGTFDEIQDGRSQVPPGDFPKWMPATQRRLLQLPSLQKPNKVVAQDGSGDFKTITEAIAAVPKTFEGRFVIYVKAGVYKEYVTVPKDMATQPRRRSTGAASACGGVWPPACLMPSHRPSSADLMPSHTGQRIQVHAGTRTQQDPSIGHTTVLQPLMYCSRSRRACMHAWTYGESF